MSMTPYEKAKGVLALYPDDPQGALDDLRASIKCHERYAAVPRNRQGTVGRPEFYREALRLAHSIVVGGRWFSCHRHPGGHVDSVDGKCVS